MCLKSMVNKGSEGGHKLFPDPNPFKMSSSSPYVLVT